jgi:hypothetical protein
MEKTVSNKTSHVIRGVGAVDNGAVTSGACPAAAAL